MPDRPEGFVDRVAATYRLAFHNVDGLIDFLSPFAFPDFPEGIFRQISQCKFRQASGLAAVINEPVCLDYGKEIGIALPVHPSFVVVG